MKKFYYKIVLFFRNLYLNFLWKRTARLVSNADKAEQKMLNLLKNDLRYQKYLSDHTHRLIGKATAATTALLPLLGKDPNYVAPPAPPLRPVPPVDETRAAWIVDTKERPSRMGVVGSYDPWVRDPAKHPILESRRAFEEKQHASSSVTETTVIGGSAIDDLKVAINNVEQACNIEGCGCPVETKKSE